MFLWDAPLMGAKAVQISLDAELLRRVDRDPEVRKLGRSAFVRSAIDLYLRAKERHAEDDAIRRAYGGRADAMLGDVEEFLGAQAWPKK
jgi:metal-responsive CopG/Arc/MetJ family transcriptional regulator